MERNSDFYQTTHTRCLALVVAANQAQGWKLDVKTCQRYADEIAPLLAADAPDDLIADVVANYHADHLAVKDLLDPALPGHASAWEQWMRQVLHILQHAGLAWLSDGAVDSEDLVQIACAELARALPSYRYQSRLSAWAYRVIVQITRRYLRDSRRAKRAIRPDSLDRLTSVDDSAPVASEAAEETVHARLLYEQVRAVLDKQPDQRLGLIFHLAAIEDRRVAEIGALVQLSQPRVRALLQQIRQVLREHPTLQAWAEAGE
jgi:RNA polymerase sigma factor (sigma-70 family)